MCENIRIQRSWILALTRFLLEDVFFKFCKVELIVCLINCFETSDPGRQILTATSIPMQKMDVVGTFHLSYFGFTSLRDDCLLCSVIVESQGQGSVESSVLLSAVMDSHRSLQIIWRAGNPQNSLFAFAICLFSLLKHQFTFLIKACLGAY